MAERYNDIASTRLREYMRYLIADILPAAVIAICLLAFNSSLCQAKVFPMPKEGDALVGRMGTVRASAEDTLLDIARRHDLGYNEIVAANPGVDPWLPANEAAIIVPTRFILPDAPRNGIVINLAEMRLYFYRPATPKRAAAVMTFPIGIGQEGWATPLARTQIIGKRRHPAWTVPDSIRADSLAQGEPLPRVVPAGPENPLGDYAIRLALPGYLIHGTNKPYGVGRRVSHGCIRMYPEDIAVLYATVSAGTVVRIVDQPFKVGREHGMLYLEAHEAIAREEAASDPDNLVSLVRALVAVSPTASKEKIKTRVWRLAGQHDGVPRRLMKSGRGPVGQGGWWLQLGAFSMLGNAMQLAQDLRWMPAPVAVRARIQDGYCHVLAGPFPDKALARQTLSRFTRKNGQEGRLLNAMPGSGWLAACRY